MKYEDRLDLARRTYANARQELTFEIQRMDMESIAHSPFEDDWDDTSLAAAEALSHAVDSVRHVRKIMEEGS